MKIITNTAYDFDDFLIQPQISNGLVSRAEAVTLDHDSAYPIMCANMSTIGTPEMVMAMAHNNCYGALHKHVTEQDIINVYAALPHSAHRLVFISLGQNDVTSDRLDRLAELSEIHKWGDLNICVDAANGYTEAFSERVTDVRTILPHATLMAGNVCTPDGVEALEAAGADIIKVGIGSGSVCLTRRVAGVGTPQLSAVLECVAAAKNAMICSDGGHNYPKDVAMALGVGASMVMLGGMLAGHDECSPNSTIHDDTVPFYGMSSDYAMETHFGGMKSYRSSEGRVVRVPRRGRVEGTINHILGGVRSAMLYTGARTLDEFRQKMVIRKVNNQLNRIYENNGER